MAQCGASSKDKRVTLPPTVSDSINIRKYFCIMTKISHNEKEGDDTERMVE